MKGQYQDK